ncbi:MAG: methyltransferase domain-containing protein [Rhizomicrobium sp.]
MPDTPETYDPRRFRTTVPYYARFRLGYPQGLIERVIAIVGLKPGGRVMDLGCGPGLLAIPFARAGMAVTAVDPEPEMLAAAEAGAREAGLSIAFRQGSSFDLPSGIGPFRLVTMGRAFHWMDRTETLMALDRIVAPDGAVALFDDDHPRTVENRWRLKLREIGDKFGRGESSHVVAREKGDYRTHESYLLDSAFSEIERTGIVVRRELDADHIVGLAYSLSTSSPEKLGDRAAEFERELRRELAEISPDGKFVEIAEMGALIARRP